MINWRFPSEYRSRTVERCASSLPKIHSEDEALFLAEKLGIEVIFVHLEEAKGGLLWRGKQAYIVINSKFPPTERAKTILHEIAHFLLHHANYLRPVFLDHKSFIAGLEKEADYFAFLLMREWLEEEESL